MTVATRIAILEDHKLLAESLAVTLRVQGLDVTVVEMQPVQEVLATLRPDDSLLVLLDLDLGEPLVDGVSLVRPLRDAGARVLVVTGTTDTTRIACAVEAGAVGYVRKEQPFDVLLENVLHVVNGGDPMPPGARDDLLALLRTARADDERRLAPFRALTEREQAVLTQLVDGKSVEQIATEWVVSEATVRTQVRGVLTKLDVRSQLAAVARARAAGWRISR